MPCVRTCAAFVAFALLLLVRPPGAAPAAEVRFEKERRPPATAPTTSPTSPQPAKEATEAPASKPKPAAGAAVAAKPAKVTVAVFKLKDPVLETPTGEDVGIPLFTPPGESLKDLVARMKRAAGDAQVKAVVLMVEDGAAMGTAQIEEVRQALAAVRAAGKKVYAHSDSMGLGKYVLLAGADRLSVSPHADLFLTGVYGEQPYVRGLLDLIGVRPEFLTCGDYKSAAEIFTRAGPSPEADKMTNWILDSIYETTVKQIAAGRKVDLAKARAWLDDGPYTAERAREAGLIDAVEHRQDFEATVRREAGGGDEAAAGAVAFDTRYGKKAPPQVDFSSPFAMFRIFGEMMGASAKRASTRDAVGIVYVEGPIVEGSAQADPFGGLTGAVAAASDLRRALDKAANDPAIKAVVLRVDSPGGSAVASEIILDATMRVRSKKPLVVSMGNVAGSGGYYVACSGSTIFADESTITASIGVVSGKFVTTPMWNKVGITWQPYQRGRNAHFMNTNAPFTDEERRRLQGLMDEIYGVFKKHVTDSRGAKLKKPIDELAGGRVFTGRQALELGLVDRIGTLADAVAFAAGEAKLKEGAYDVRPVPEPKNFFELLMEEGQDAGAGRLLRAAHAAGAAGAAGTASGEPSLVELALPHLAGLDPARVAQVKASLRRLQLMQRHGVLMMMHELPTSAAGIGGR